MSNAWGRTEFWLCPLKSDHAGEQGGRVQVTWHVMFRFGFGEVVRTGMVEFC